ncbi:MAG: PIN domain-containing protein [Candidatus Hydrothermarchaeales archaeon]
MGRIGIDANVFLCVLLPESTKTDAENVSGSERILRSIGSRNAGITSSIALAEVAWAFLREGKDGVELEAARHVIETMSGLKIVSVENSIAWEAGKLRRRYYTKKSQLSYQDAIYLITCIKRVDAFYTTDAHLLKIKGDVPIIEAKMFE